MTTNTPSRRWCFTLNNPDGLLTKEDFESLTAIRYAVYQEEVGDDTGTYHLQGYIECTRSVRFSYFSPILRGAHFDLPFGSAQQCITYCTKEDTRVGDPFEYGERNAGGQGRRTDLHAACEAVAEGKSEREIAELHPTTFVKYYRGIRELARVRSAPRVTKTRCVVYWGATSK